ncbi:MAG: ABC transporter permease [Clostridiales Family XIII bacterium]|jgi:osmoprotectant transport system permease protein|nr:ABC transporter permease [Clostridiales Family XIII bacterium]
MAAFFSKFFPYFTKHWDDMGELLLDHLQIAFTVLGISLIVSAGLSILIYRSEFLSTAVLGLFGAIYSIPSLALFSVLVPLLGLGKPSAVFALVLYLQYILIRNILAGFHAISPAVLEAGAGMGLSPAQLFLRIRLPLALPIIIGGMRIAIVAAIGMTVIAATINAGGLGMLLFEGLRTHYPVKIVWGTLLCAGITWIANSLMYEIEKYCLKKANGELPAKEVIKSIYGKKVA